MWPTHQWGSSVAVTTMTSSLKKASWSELTALQSTSAFTFFCVGRLLDAMAFLRGRGAGTVMGEAEGVEPGAESLVTKLQ